MKSEKRSNTWRLKEERSKNRVSSFELSTNEKREGKGEGIKNGEEGERRQMEKLVKLLSRYSLVWISSLGDKRGMGGRDIIITLKKNTCTMHKENNINYI